MNFEDLSNKIIITITDWILTLDNDNNKYKYVSIPECYYKADSDIKRLGLIIKDRFNLNENNDIIQSFFDDYFIFKFRNIYIIINVNEDEYKIIKVFSRKEALTYRFG